MHIVSKPLTCVEFSILNGRLNSLCVLSIANGKLTFYTHVHTIWCPWNLHTFVCIHKQMLGAETVELPPAHCDFQHEKENDYSPGNKEPLPMWSQITFRNLCKNMDNRKGARSLMTGKYPDLVFFVFLKRGWKKKLVFWKLKTEKSHVSLGQ